MGKRHGLNGLEPSSAARGQLMASTEKLKGEDTFKDYPDL